MPTTRCDAIARHSRGLFVVVLAALVACVGEAPPADRVDTCGVACTQLADSRAAVLRDNLRDNLRRVMARDATIFGQQRFNITGVNEDGTQWLSDENRVNQSNARDLSGSDPGVLGIDVWDFAIKPASWSPGPAVHALAARRVFAEGGVVTMEWHMRGCNRDELDGAGFYAAGNEDCLCRVANDPQFARRWLIEGKLRRFADALVAHGLADVPIVFRPLHEMTGGWFWWGYDYWDCDRRVPGAMVTGPAAYRDVFRQMIDYLRIERGLDNLLVAYAPDKLGRGIGSSEEARYLAGYPGDFYVDVLGIDLYYMADLDFAMQSAEYARYLRLVTRLAKQRGKIAALTETGNYRLATEDSRAESRWFTEHLLPLVHGDPDIRLAFALTWENRRASPSNFYVPYVGHAGADDFRAFAAHPGVLMLGDVSGLYQPAADTDGTDTPPVCASCASDSDGDGVGVEAGVPCVAPPSCLPPAPYPVCERCDADGDGDGWGWENGESCTVPSSCSEQEGYATCDACESDPDGDGWGWEHEASCVVPASCVTGYPVCADCDSDPDGDGWGWENESSCIVPASCR